MKRLYEPAAYTDPNASFWADTYAGPPWPQLETDRTVDCAVIGGGFTGLNAALSLAQAGASVAVLEAQSATFGASVRNGGFCCLGGAMASRRRLLSRYGATELRLWHNAERAAVAHVSDLIDRHGWDVDRHSDGETLMAHTARAWHAMQEEAETVRADYGVPVHLTPRAALPQDGLGGPWHGALTIPVGFALNPAKYHAALAQVAQREGAALYGSSPVTTLRRDPQGWRLTTPRGTITADRVILATNGYSSEDVPPWLRARTLPTLSHVLVTRPLTPDELAAQGWTSRQMAFDSRTLLHYFRLMPDNRFLFGMRGGLRASGRAQARSRAAIRRDFAKLFPAWRHVEITHDWSGLVCLMARLHPFVGPVPDHPGLFAALGYHGNGVAMGSYAGSLVGALALGQTPPGPYPAAMRQVPRRFPLGPYRRALLRPVYAMASAFDL